MCACYEVRDVCNSAPWRLQQCSVTHCCSCEFTSCTRHINLHNTHTLCPHVMRYVTCDIYIYTYIHIYTHIYTYIYIYILCACHELCDVCSRAPWIICIWRDSFTCDMSLSHVTWRITMRNERHVTCEWVTSNTSESRSTAVHVTVTYDVTHYHAQREKNLMSHQHMDESCHTYGWVVSHIGWVMSHIWIGHSWICLSNDIHLTRLTSHVRATVLQNSCNCNCVADVRRLTSHICAPVLQLCCIHKSNSECARCESRTTVERLIHEWPIHRVCNCVAWLFIALVNAHHAHFTSIPWGSVTCNVTHYHAQREKSLTLRHDLSIRAHVQQFVAHFYLIWLVYTWYDWVPYVMRV